MSGTFYSKLALDNIRKNSKNYLPYIITCIFTVAMYYIMKSLSLNKGLNDAFGGGVAVSILTLGSNVIAFFAFIFLFYTNSFLTKKRKKEFGIYNILGMEKRHIAKVIGYESLYVALISFVGGLGVGILFDKLMYVAISRLMKVNFALGFYVSTGSIYSTLILFSILFLIIFINSLRMIHFSNPIELLKGGNVGEKEPKAKWFIALLGLICLGAGYYISLTIKNPIMALTLFFVAVILVIVGTYLIFVSGSIVFLKILKKNKSYYYKTNHFISVSGMMYRMKQNAVGLANICILSTMVLVMVSSTSSLIIGIDDILMQRYPYQMEFMTWDISNDEFQQLKGIIDDTAKDEGVQISDYEAYTYLQFAVVYSGGDTLVVSNAYASDLTLINDVCEATFITAEDYELCTGRQIVLESDEVLLYCHGREFSGDYFMLFDERYNIVNRVDEYVKSHLVNPDITPSFCFVVSDIDVINHIYEKQKKFHGSEIYSNYMVNIDGDSEEQIAFYKKAVDNVLHNLSVHFGYGCREDSRQGCYELYGSLFFMGIFLSLLFTMATVIIIYYKQISEGMDDKNRFEIMQKVGMSEQEVKNSIKSQVITVFFMPLIMAGMHIAFAFPILKSLLAAMQLSNVKLFIMCTVFSYLAFSVIYEIIYLMTAKTYYKIVKR